MFEKIHVAYELLASIELQVTETDLNNVVLLINTQNIIYRRFSDDVAAQKYPAYSLLVSVLNLPGPGQQLEGTQANLIIAGTMLMHNTCCVSPLNGKEFVKCNGVAKLYEIFGYALQYFISSNTPSDIYSKLLIYSMKAFMSVSQFDVGQEAIAKLCPKFAEDVYTLLYYYQKVPLAIENALELISRCASLPALQDAFTQAGVIWRLIPMLLAYDGTVEEDFSDENQRAVYNQKASNMHGIVAAKALGRLGYLPYHSLTHSLPHSLSYLLTYLLTCRWTYVR
jgi:DnaJ family protein C protein 13